MKKIICLLLSVLFTLSLAMPVFADGENAGENFLDKYPIANSEDYLKTLMNKDLYHSNMGNIVIDNDSKLVQIFCLFPFIRVFDCDFDEMMQQAETEASTANEWGKIKRYFAVVNGEDVSFVTIVTKDNTVTVYRDMRLYDEYTYMNDIKNMTTNIQICGIECEVKRIACYDLDSSHFGTLVYLDTDKGSFVRYYANHDAPAVEMTEAEYQVIAEQYCNYLDSLPDGIGGGTSFAEFIENPIIVDPPAKDDNENGVENLTTGTVNNPTNEKDSGASTLWWIIPTAVAVILLGGAIAFIAYRKKKT